MSRIESDRDDLFAELASCSSRWELSCDGCAVPVLIGIRKENAMSLFFGSDQVYHYNHENQLKRAYVHGYLYRTHGNTLARLERKRSETETTLLRHDLNEQELGTFLESMRIPLLVLLQALSSTAYQVLRTDSKTEEVCLKEIRIRIEECHQSPLKLAPAFPTRRT